MSDAGLTRGETVTYDAAWSRYREDLAGASERYQELSYRDLCARTAWQVRQSSDFDPANHGHQLLAEYAPLGLVERLELMAIGEVLARYYRHPAMLHQAATAGASWEQIAAARGTSEAQARQDYREWADCQHRLWLWYDRRWGLDEAAYTTAIERAGTNAP